MVWTVKSVACLLSVSSAPPQTSSLDEWWGVCRWWDKCTLKYWVCRAGQGSKCAQDATFIRRAAPLGAHGAPQARWCGQRWSTRPPQTCCTKDDHGTNLLHVAQKRTKDDHGTSKYSSPVQMCLDLAHQAQPPLLRAADTNIGHSFLLCTAIVKKEQRMPKVIKCYMCPKYVAKDLFMRTRVATTRSWSIFLLLSSTLPKIKSSVFHRPRASQYLRCSTTISVELIPSSWGGKERNGTNYL